MFEQWYVVTLNYISKLLWFLKEEIRKIESFSFLVIRKTERPDSNILQNRLSLSICNIFYVRKPNHKCSSWQEIFRSLFSLQTVVIRDVDSVWILIQFHFKRPLSLNSSNIAAPILAGDSTTLTPASLKLFILSWAVPLPPETMASSIKKKNNTRYNAGLTWKTVDEWESWGKVYLPPAWPIRRPGGAVSPAMKATTGFSVPLSCLIENQYVFILNHLKMATLDSLRRCIAVTFIKAAASSSAVPPISPMRTIPEKKSIVS